MQLFEIDINTPQPAPKTWDGLVADCARCLEPIREVLKHRGVTNPTALELSDLACTAALLTRLWRDVRVDVIENGCVYLPADVAAKHGLDLPLMVKALTLDADRGPDGQTRTGSCDCASLPKAGLRALTKPYRATMRELVHRTDQMFLNSRALWPMLPPDLRRTGQRMTYDSRATLRLIARHGYDTMTQQPALGRVARAWIGLRLRLSG